MYCATDDEASINEGIERVKKILSENFVRPDEAEKIKSKIKEMREYSIIDKVSVTLNIKTDSYWDTVAFDEVAGIKFKDKDGVQIMKDFMVSGSFARGKEEKNASASMVFVGNINQSTDSLIKSSHLFAPFPEEMSSDSAFFDRMHYYIPGWEIPKMHPKHFTDGFGFIVDYMAEFFREMRKRSFADVTTRYYNMGTNLNQRDMIAVKKTVSGLIKLVYPNGEFKKEDVEEILRNALEGRRRVKEQLKKIGGMEFYDVHFSYIDKEYMNEEFVSVPEQGGGKLIPEGMCKAGHVYTAGRGDSGMIGVYKLENQAVSGSGKFEKSGVGTNREVKESLDTAFRYFKSNRKTVSATISTTTKDYIMHIADLQGIGLTKELAIAELVGLCSSALERPLQEGLVVVGNMTVGGTISKIDDFANLMQVIVDAGGKKVLIPASVVADYQTVPADLLVKIQPIFYSDPIDAVFKALGAL